MFRSSASKRLGWFVVAAVAAAGCGPEADASQEAPELTTQQAALTQVTSFGTNPGNLTMYKYVPAGVPTNAPLVVALHGCTQTASAYQGAGWNALADVLKFYVLYPEQKSANNSSSCFNWFEVGDITRGQGEALSIKQMVDKMKADHSIDPGRVFVTGLSAGGAMTGVMAATYPDVFSGAAIMAGIPYKCATSSSAAFSCMSPGVDKTPIQWGDLVRGAYAGYTGARPKVSIWHGTSDLTVKVMNLTEQLQQWTDVHGIDQTADVSETVAGFPHKVYKDGAGVARVETYELTNMGHGTAVDPQFVFPGSSVGCGATGSYLLDVNICSTWYAAKFFGITSGGGGGTTPQTATFSSIAAEDGYVKANADGSAPAVGTLANLAVGRGTDGLQNRTVLSFDTSSLPDSAVVVRAYVRVTYASGSGNPWGNPAGNSLLVDVKTGTFGAAGTETTDFLAAPTSSNVASIAQFSTGTKDSSDFSSAGLSAINRTGRTQLKLRFAQAPTTTNYVFLTEGTGAVLTVEYQ
jgi:poly(hydroxyalkanoate) depolymerase family esterase